MLAWVVPVYSFSQNSVMPASKLNLSVAKLLWAPQEVRSSVESCVGRRYMGLREERAVNRLSG